MVADLSSAVLRDSFVAEAPFLKLSKGGENRPTPVLRGHPREHGESGQDDYLKRDAVHRHALLSPSNFSISSVDPLHYLGITPTVQSAQLLQACKHKHPRWRKLQDQNG
jgi:hypothetical protein